MTAGTLVALPASAQAAEPDNVRDTRNAATTTIARSDAARRAGTAP